MKEEGKEGIPSIRNTPPTRVHTRGTVTASPRSRSRLPPARLDDAPPEVETQGWLLCCLLPA